MREYADMQPTANTLPTRIAYLSPFSNLGNPYIDLQKAILRELGFVVVPLSADNIYRLEYLRGLFNRRNLITTHWLETRPFLQRAPSRTFNWRGLLALVGYAMILRLARARTVYFIHNHHAHDTSGRARAFSARLMQWISALVDIRVVHDPSAQAQYNATYLPHPLYRELQTYERQTRDLQPLNSTPLFGIVGSVRPYKGIVELLRVWPPHSPLLIAGHADAAQRDLLCETIKTHQLSEVVSTDLRFLSAAELDTLLDRIDVMILPHQLDSVLVSGAFFEAVGRVPLILARATPFMRWAEKRIHGIRLFEKDTDLPGIVADIRAQWPHCAASSSAVQAQQLFGWESCRAAYAKVFALNE